MTEGPTQPKSLAELQALTDDQVVALFDGNAPYVEYGTGFWLDELERRSQARSAKATLELAEAANRRADVAIALAVASLVVTMAAAIADTNGDPAIRTALILVGCILGLAVIVWVIRPRAST